MYANEELEELQPDDFIDALQINIASHEALVDKARREVDKERKEIAQKIISLGYTKNLIIAKRHHLASLQNLECQMPNLRPVIEEISLYIEAQILAKKPIGFPPMCLLGPPGNGKSYAVHQFAKALGLPVKEFQLAGTNEHVKLFGASRHYEGCGPGDIAQFMADCTVANPIFIFEEIDKVSTYHGDNVTNSLLMVLEKENARVMEDNYVGTPINLSYASFICTANSTEPLTQPMLSRLQMVNVPQPTHTQRQVIMQNIYSEALKSHGLEQYFISVWPDEFINCLSTLSIREAKRHIERSIFIAIRNGKKEGTLKPILQFEEPTETKRRIGFY